MKILNLLTTQNSLRNINSVDNFRKIIREGDLKTLCPIQLVRLKGTNLLYIWNGHHRLFAAYKEDIRELSDDCFQITEMSRAQISSPNLDVGYVTPFDILYECRKSDFMEYKNLVNTFYKTHPEKYNTILSMIASLQHLYCERRTTNFILDLY